MTRWRFTAARRSRGRLKNISASGATRLGSLFEYARVPGGNEVFIMRIGRYESSESNHAGTAITFLLIGLGMGALAGLLLAPKSGKALRRDIQRGYEDAKDTLEEWADEAKDRVRDAGDRVRGVVTRSIDAATDAAEDLRDAAREKAEPIRRAINRG